MLEERAGELQPVKKDLDVVFAELGAPMELAAKYRDNKRGLIGPGLYLQYSLAARVVLLCVAFGVTAAVVIGALAGTSEPWPVQILRFAANLFASELASFGAVTLVFAILERKDITMEELIRENGSANLPPVPKKRRGISRSECIVGMIFEVLVIILFVFFPGLMAAYLPQGAVPIFDAAVIRGAAMPPLLICFVLGILGELIKFIDRDYTKRVFLFTVVSDAASLILSVLAFYFLPVFNAGFMEELFAATGWEPNPFLFSMWEKMPLICSALFIFAFVLDAAVIVYRYYRTEKAVEQPEQY